MPEGLNFVDIIILAIIFISVIIGFVRGFVSEVIALLTLIAAFVIAIMFSSSLAAYFTNLPSVQSMVSQSSAAIGTSTAKPVTYLSLAISFGLLFFATVLIGSLVRLMLNLAFQTGILGFGNRVFGGGFGLIRGLLINLVLIFIVQLSPMANQSWWQQSQYVPYFQPSVAWLGSIVSPALNNLKDTFGSTVKDMTDSVSTFRDGLGK